MESDEKFNILIVDDEEEVLRALKRTLERAKEFDANISLASDAEEAKDKLSRNDYDLVLSDYNMPKMNGVQLLQWVKEEFPDIVRIIITGYSDLETARDAINQANVHNYIEKPWDNKALTDTIHQTIVRKKQRDEKDLKKVQTAQEAIKTIIELQDQAISVESPDKLQDQTRSVESPDKLQDQTRSVEGPDKYHKQKTMFSFKSPADFNNFSFMLKGMGNVAIEDIQVFEDNYIVIVSIYPKNISRIK